MGADCELFQTNKGGGLEPVGSVYGAIQERGFHSICFWGGERIVKCLLGFFAALAVLPVVLPALCYCGQFRFQTWKQRDWMIDSTATCFSPPWTLNSSAPGCFPGFTTNEGEMR